MDLKPYEEIKQEYDNLKGFSFEEEHSISQQTDNIILRGNLNKHHQKKRDIHAKSEKI